MGYCVASGFYLLQILCFWETDLTHNMLRFADSQNQRPQRPITTVNPVDFQENALVSPMKRFHSVLGQFHFAFSLDTKFTSFLMLFPFLLVQANQKVRIFFIAGG